MPRASDPRYQDLDGNGNRLKGWRFEDEATRALEPGEIYTDETGANGSRIGFMDTDGSTRRTLATLTDLNIATTEVTSVVGGIPLTVNFPTYSALTDVEIRDAQGTIISDTLVFKVVGTAVTICSNLALVDIQITVEGNPL